MGASLAEDVVVHRLFDAKESILIDRALAAVTRKAPADAATLRVLINELAALSEILNTTRELRKQVTFGKEIHNAHTLTEHLCQIDALSGDLALPMKATLSRTFLLAKINFFKAFIKATSALHGSGSEFAEFAYHLREELAQSIYTQLAEELLLAFLRNPNVKTRIKRKSADQLITIWDNSQVEIDDFCPLLESAWHARNRVTSGFGSLLGTTEYFRLVCEDCAPQFLDFFGRDDLSLAEGQAFEEFLFNMSYEELTTLRETMKEQNLDTVTANWASRVLGRPIEPLDHSGKIDPMALYRSYYRRQLAAEYRSLAGTDGPRRTAESYLMIYLLDQQD
ncbi:MAG: hypothetical protein MJE77_30475 [Proteobacteria bacterium]|nr:hypothetical protein [Pseudomonadota bacterium]